jgi:gliding motility-associated-like protein
VTVNPNPSILNVVAGKDDIICEGSDYYLSGSGASNYSSLKWATNGSGKFDDSSILHPNYIPSQSDIINGKVVLSLTASTECANSTASMTLLFSYKALPNAGPDESIDEHSTFTVSSATAKYSTAVSWSHNGKGTMENANTLTPTYVPLLHETGLITLTLTATSAAPCGNVSDQMILTIKPVNHPPVAVPDDYEAKENNPLAGNVISNDWDFDGNHLTLDTIPVHAPAHGKILLSPNGEFTYRSNIDFMGQDAFTYRIFDNGNPSLDSTALVTITVVKDESCEVMVPNAFSPNNDGIHDYFKVRCLYNYQNPVIEIYNRWGNLIYKKEHYGDVDFWGSEAEAWWNGYSNGKMVIGSNNPAPVGTYYYILKLDKNKTLTGFLFLNR